MADAALKPEWRERFEFFERYGAPYSAEARAAFKALPRDKRRLVGGDFAASYLLGPVYFLVLGMWKRALILISIGVAMVFLTGVIDGASPGRLSLMMLLLSLSFASMPGYFVMIPLLVVMFEPFSNHICNLFFCIIMFCTSVSQFTVNYSYYLKLIKGDNGWNPFKGMGRRDVSVLLVSFVVMMAMALWLDQVVHAYRRI